MTWKENKEKSVNLLENVGTSGLLVMHSTVLSSSATSSLQSFELESSLEQIHDMDDADQMEKMEQVDEEEEVEWMVEKKVEQKSQVDRMEKDDQLDQVKKEEQLDEMKQDEQLEQQALSPSTVAANTTDQVLLEMLLHMFVWTTNSAKPWISSLVLRSTLLRASHFYHYFYHTGFSVAAESPVDPRKQGGWRFFKTKISVLLLMWNMQRHFGFERKFRPNRKLTH